MLSSSRQLRKKILFSSVSLLSLVLIGVPCINHSRHQRENRSWSLQLSAHCLILFSFTPIYWPQGECFSMPQCERRIRPVGWEQRTWNLSLLAKVRKRVWGNKGWLRMAPQKLITRDSLGLMLQTQSSSPHLSHRLASHTCISSACTSQEYS